MEERSRNEDNCSWSLLFNDLVAHKNVTQRLSDPEEGRGKREERTRVKRREEDVISGHERHVIRAKRIS